MYKDTTLRERLITGWRIIAARPSFKKVNDLLFDFAIHGLGLLNYGNDSLTGERYFCSKILPSLLGNKEQLTFIDVGAHQGEYSELLLEFHPGAKIVAVEPHPLTFQRLQSALHNRVLLLECALGSEVGELTLYARVNSEGSEHASLHAGAIADLQQTQVQGMPVKVETLDRLAVEQDLSHIDLLKIDTEGHEYEVLKGCQRLLAENRIGVIHIEFNQMNVVSRSFFRDFAQLLSHHKPYRLLPSGMIPVESRPLKSELFAFQNIVFIPKDAIS